MEALAESTAVYTAFGRLLAYPDDELVAAAQRLAVQLRGECPKACKALGAFVSEAGFQPPARLEEIYSRAFDLSPLAIPYVGVYLFGEDDRKRARLMAGLKAVFENAGVDLCGELPDHLGVLLRHADAFTPEEFAELAQWCLPGPISAMRQALEKSGNAYRHVAAAVQAYFAAQYPEEFKRC
jgi:nitrate reductase delta subunit